MLYYEADVAVCTCGHLVIFYNYLFSSLYQFSQILCWKHPWHLFKNILSMATNNYGHPMWIIKLF